MKHARTDYQRIQDPAANAPLLDAYNRAMSRVAHGPLSTPKRADAAAVESVRNERNDALEVLGELCRALTPILGELVTADGIQPLPGGSKPIGDDEPVFILRARDALAPQVVERWCELLYKSRGENDGGRTRHAVIGHAAAMRAWAQVNGSKIPDTPPGVLVDVDALDEATAVRQHYGGRGHPPRAPDELQRVHTATGGILELLGRAERDAPHGQQWADKLRLYERRLGQVLYAAGLEHLTAGERERLTALLRDYPATGPIAEPPEPVSIDPSDR